MHAIAIRNLFSLVMPDGVLWESNAKDRTINADATNTLRWFKLIVGGSFAYLLASTRPLKYAHEYRAEWFEPAAVFLATLAARVFIHRAPVTLSVAGGMGIGTGLHYVFAHPSSRDSLPFKNYNPLFWVSFTYALGGGFGLVKSITRG